MKYEIVTNISNCKYKKEIISMLSDFWKHLEKLDWLGKIKYNKNFKFDYINYINYLFNQCGGCIILALDNETPVGLALNQINIPWDMIKNTVSDYNEVELVDLYVKPEYRCRGIGESLIKLTKEVYKESGCNQMVIGLLSANEDAYRLYKKLGFKENVIEMAQRL